MCLSCGCGKPNDNRGDSRNITQNDVNVRNISMHDVENAAHAANITPEQVMQNINNSVEGEFPHHAWGEMRSEPGPSEIDYGVSQSSYTEEQQSGTLDNEGELIHTTDAQGNKRLMRDGYAETEGAGYGATQPQTGAVSSEAQKGYDPSQSSVKPSKKKPGKRIQTPGRETGTAWSEGMQMGKTDAPDRRNPAN